MAKNSKLLFNDGPRYACLSVQLQAFQSSKNAKNSETVSPGWHEGGTIKGDDGQETLLNNDTA